MKGKHTVKVSDKRVRYSFELVRNITVVQGNSGTGKTKLFDLVSAYSRMKDRSGVQIVCDKPCVALYADSDWQTRLGNTHDSIVFIDEDAEYISSHTFASTIRHTDSYYVIFCRESLHGLPYSVEEIYEIKTSKRLHT
ncbi:MAG: Fis family transcriptional regulator [Blautia sp.]|nr:Fis family transcriptional regulator [Blautia sp.]